MMTMNPGVWMSCHGGGAALILGTPAGRHCAVGSSFECEPLLRSSNSALAQAWNGTSSGFRSAARFCTYLPLGSQIPDRSGRPSASRGAGAARFGLPSDVRGIARAGTFSHWAPAGRHIKESTIKPRGNTFLDLSSIFITASGGVDYSASAGRPTQLASHDVLRCRFDVEFLHSIQA